jgi:hypothetical protein
LPLLLIATGLVMACGDENSGDGVRRAGAVRELPPGMVDQAECHQQGRTDAEQDARAGKSLPPAPLGIPLPGGTGFVYTAIPGAAGGPNPSTLEVRYFENGVLAARVLIADAFTASVRCGQAYVDGYRGEPFVERTGT